MKNDDIQKKIAKAVSDYDRSVNGLTKQEFIELVAVIMTVATNPKVSLDDRMLAIANTLLETRALKIQGS